MRYGHCSMHPRLLPRLALCVLGAIAAAACRTLPPSAGTPRQPSLAAQLDALLAQADPGLHVGIQVRGADSKRVLYEKNAHQRFAPASTLKLFTAAATLAYLGPTYRFMTEVRTDVVGDGTTRPAVVKRLYLRGTGDPSLTQWSLAHLAAMVKQAGINQVTEELIVDDTAFDAVPWGKGWMWDDLVEAYSAPVGALNVEGDAFVVGVLPGAAVGAPAVWVPTPHTNFVTVVNRVSTGAAGSPRAVAASVRTATAGDLAADSQGLSAGDVITLTGSVPLDATGPAYKAFAVRDPGLYTAALWREALQQAGVRMGTSEHSPSIALRHGRVPETSRLLALHHAPETATLLAAYMKASDNHGMECLLKSIGSATAQAAGTWPNGLVAVRTFLQDRVGIMPEGLSLRDGSGISRYSLITPEQMTTLLQYMHQDFATGPEFIAALPIGGVDGTLSERFTDVALRGRVRAKTGSMSGVSNLAGYVETPDHTILSFSIMMEGLVGSTEPSRNLQERIVSVLATTPTSDQE